MSDQNAWVEVELRGSDTVVKVFGEVDISNVTDIEKALDHAVDNERARHIVDLSETRYFDSSGIRVLFSLATRLHSRRQELHIVVPETGLTRRVLELTGIPNVIPMHASFAELDPSA